MRERFRKVDRSCQGQHPPIALRGMKPLDRNPVSPSWTGRKTACLAVLGTCLSLMPMVAQADPLPMPAMDGPLVSASPIPLAAGPLGNLELTGVVSGLGIWQAHPSLGSESAPWGISNSQVFLQKTHGLVQFYLEAGAYEIPALGTPILSPGSTLSEDYGAVPEAYLKIVPGPQLSILVGKIPTLAGAEYTFTFENLNIQRGLLWNQENAVTRGIQANYHNGPMRVSLSWNDGFYSGRFNWLAGELSFAFPGGSSVAFVGMGNLGSTRYESASTPLDQNNGAIYNFIYTDVSGPWIVQPYLQYTRVPRNAALGIEHGAATRGAALLTGYRLTPEVTFAFRGEYLASTGDPQSGAPNLVYGPGSRAWSITFTPTYQYHDFFARAEFSYVRAINFSSGDAFGRAGAASSQSSILVESGFFF